MATIKKLYFSSGVAVTAPTDLTSESSTVKIQPYVDDAAYVTANGVAQEGDVYLNNTFNKLRTYIGSSWRNCVPESDGTDATKLFLVDISGNSTGVSVTLDFNATANRVYAIPDYNGIAVLNTGTEAAPILYPSATGNIDIGGSGSTVRLQNLIVQGTTTTLNTTVTDVLDPNVTVNKGGNDASSEGSGITVDRTGTKGSLIYAAAAASKFKAGDVGAEVELADISTAQTLTNKTISGASNTISNVNLTSQVTGVLPTANGGTNVNSTATFPSSGTIAVVPTSGVVKSNGSILSSSNVSLTTEVTGTLPIGNGGTGQTTANTALNALLPAQGSSASKFLQTDGTNTSWQTASGGGSSEVTVAKAVDYTVLDNDTYTTILVTTGGTNKTITLPTVGDNTNRILRIKKVDSSAGVVIVDGEGAESIDGDATKTLAQRYSEITIQSDGASWHTISFGYIGETVAATITANTSTAGASGVNPEVDITGASLVITPGKWVFYYFGTVSQSILASAGNAAYSRVRITTSANVHVPYSSTFTSDPFNGSSTAWTQYKLHSAAVPVTVTSTTTYKLRLQANFDGTTGSCTFRGDNSFGAITGFDDTDTEAAFFAVRTGL